MPFTAVLLALALVAQAPGPIVFDDLASAAGVAKGGDPGAVAWFDADGDGDDDLFVAAIGKDRLFRNDGAGRFTKLKGTGLDRGSDPSFGVAVADYDNDGLLDVFVANLGAANKLYHNEGAGRFRDVTRDAGVGGGPQTNSYSAAWADYDRDGLVDLYVANGSQQSPAKNFLYHNEGGGRFREVADAAGTGGNESSLGCAWGDYDGDGWPDLYVANFGQPNRLYRNRGDGTFGDRAREAGVDDAGNGAGAAWGDYDNDGRLDLYLFNTNSGATADRLYRNRGGARFADVTIVAGVAGTGAGQPAAAADYDGDGRLDLYVGNLPGRRDELFHNRTEAGRALEVRLTGTRSNRAAIGARVTVTAGGLTMTREISSSSGRSSQNGFAAHFGLGSAAGADAVEIRWPSGAVERLENVAAGAVEVLEP
jgi:hypothetical protein